MENRAAPLLAFVVPCYNESCGLDDSSDELLAKLNCLKIAGRVSEDSCIIFVDDGSADDTWEVISRIVEEKSHCKGLRFRFNAGKDAALYAGMMLAKKMKVSCVVTIDADLQDDLQVIDGMLEAHEKGAEVVYGVKDCRAGDAPLKRFCSRLFYTTAATFGVRLIPQHSDFRLVSYNVLKVLVRYRETALFLRALIPSFNFKSEIIKYSIRERKFGCSRYSTVRLLALASQGVASFSAAPLRIAGLLGLGVLILAVIAGGMLL